MPRTNSLRLTILWTGFFIALSVLAMGQEASSEILLAANRSEASWYSGFDIVIAQPLYSNNLGLKSSNQPSPQQFNVQNNEFAFDYEASPRVWLGYQAPNEVGLRAVWWQYAAQANALSISPSASGFGRVEHPSFGDIDISAITPTELITAAADLEAYTIDLELTRQDSFGAGEVLLSGGLRFASLNQSYNAALWNANAVQAGEIDFRQDVRGLGPTISAMLKRSLTNRWHWYASGRGSLLLGEGNELLQAGEDLDFVNPQRTSETSQRDQMLPIVDVQLGTSMQLPEVWGMQNVLRGGWEMSWWGDVGNSAGAASDLGFAGFTIGAETRW
jgi:hypothetical protein